jgi:hypothetical protein
VTVQDRALGVWGRTMEAGAGGLPSQVTTQGCPLLAQPVTLTGETADGKAVRLQGGDFRVVSRADHRVVAEGTGSVGGLDVRSRVTVEFDGLYKVEMDLAPRQATALKALRLVIPFRPEAAQYLHASGEGIRYGFDARYVPAAGKGRLWDCRRVDGQHMAVGSFIPFVWVGGAGGGLAWFADSDEGWVPNNDAPAIEVRRDRKGSVDLVLNLISSPFTFDQPRRVVFGLQATPVKPMHKGWRTDKWWCDHTFRDFSGVAARTGNWTSIIWQAVPYPLDVEQSRKHVEQWHQRGDYAVPYFENNNMGAFRPEPGYFGEQWKAGIGGMLWFEDSLQDFIVHNLGEWARTCGIDGFYVDNVRPEPCDNIDAGRGYRLPDGRIQPTYQIFDVRRYYLRMRAAFIEAGKNPPKIVLHMTHNMVIPWLGAADIAYDGEANVIFPEMHKDFMDAWPLERLRLDYPGQWGVAVNFMSEFQGDWSRDKERLERAQRSYQGAILLHDALPVGGGPWDPGVLKMRKQFDVDAEGARFIGYWDADAGLSCKLKGVYLAGWQRSGERPRSGKLLLLVVNWSDEDVVAPVRIDAEKLDLPRPGDWKVTDAAGGQALEASRRGVIQVRVPRHDFRHVVVSPAR